MILALNMRKRLWMVSGAGRVIRSRIEHVIVTMMLLVRGKLIAGCNVGHGRRFGHGLRFASRPTFGIVAVGCLPANFGHDLLPLSRLDLVFSHVQRPLDTMKLDVKATGIAHRRPRRVASPQGRCGGGTVGTSSVGTQPSPSILKVE